MTEEGGEKVLVEGDEGTRYGSIMWNRGDTRDVNSFIAINLDPLKPFPDANSGEAVLVFHLKVGSGDNERNLGFITLQANPWTI